MKATMKALLSRAPGGTETLRYEDVEVPRPRAGEVLVAVEACGVNYPDNLMIQDLYQVKAERPFSPGAEVCGRVVGLGEGVTQAAEGDRVIGRCGWGGMAEYVVVPVDKCIAIDDAMPADEAATFLFGYATSYYALRTRAHLEAGETLLVLGAGGGVGAAAVELGRTLGARVLAAASSAGKIELALKLGAEGGVVYERELDMEGQRTLSASIKKLSGPKGVDVVFDPIGGLYSEASLRALNPNGRHLVIGFTAGIPRMPLNLALLKSCQIVGVDWRSFNLREPAQSAANTAGLLALYREGRIRPTISRRYALAEGAEAIRHLASREALGRVVVINDVAA